MRHRLKTLEQYAASKGYKVADTIMEIASGLNENREGLKRLIDLAKEGSTSSLSLIPIDLRASVFDTLRISSPLME